MAEKESDPPGPTQAHEWAYTDEQAFLLRSWQDGLGGWRFNLQAVGPEASRIGFASLAELLAYFEQRFSPDETQHGS